jgi:CRP-like cAMP-binding protein
MPRNQSNRLLDGFKTDDRRLLSEFLTPVHLRSREPLEEPNRAIAYVYFVLSGLVSITYRSRNGEHVDVGMVGYEGCTGCSVILGCDRTPHAVTVQSEGEALRITVKDFQRCLKQSMALHQTLLRYVQTMLIQRDGTALAASRGTIDQRIARWLLMANDRIRDKDIRVTHEMLADILGVRRGGATMSMRKLADLGLITSQRGRLQIADRKGLETFAGQFYGVPEAEFKRLLPSLVN